MLEINKLFFIAKNCQTIQMSLMVLLAIGLNGCQSQPKVQQSNQGSFPHSQAKPLLVQSPQKIAILLVNTKWSITLIRQQRVQVFNGQPYLYFLQNKDSAGQYQLLGSTGCNALSGSYRAHTSSIELDAKSGHEYCANALAQEAELMDGLARVRQYQLIKNTLKLSDAQGHVIIEAVAQ
jgi:heat shock protein HslJ